MKDVNDLRQYVERIFDEREKAYNAIRQHDRIALDIATRNLELRLEKLNELRQEVTQDRASYLQREIFEARMGAVERRMAWLAGVGAALVVLAGLVGTVLGFFIRK